MRGHANRGSEQIAAAARDDQATATRNGNKRDWRREKLGALLDKLEEEYREFVKDVMEGNREGMRWEGADLRWTTTMIQDHHGVLELEIESGLSPDSMSVAGINVRQLRDDKQLLEDAVDMVVDANHRLQVHLLTREDRIQQLEEALREALQMVEDAGRAYVNYSPEHLKELRSLLSSEAPEKEED